VFFFGKENQEPWFPQLNFIFLSCFIIRIIVYNINTVDIVNINTMLHACNYYYFDCDR